MENLSNSERASIKELLELKTLQYNVPDFIPNDPISLPHQFNEKNDIEIIGFIVSLFSWGKREMILKNGEKLIRLMGYSPYEYVMNYTPGRIKTTDFIHRTFNGNDLNFILLGLQKCYSENASLEDWFSLNEGESGVRRRIVNCRNRFLCIPHEKRSEKHLSNPDKNAAAKRMNMFLRWMVRKDTTGVDLGIWNTISMTELMVPLDVHTGNSARLLKLLHRKQNDWKALEELMAVLRTYDKSDPSKYDFALFGLGVTGELKEK